MTDFRDRISKLSHNRLALLATQLHERLETVESRAREPIAVIGLGCRFPGGADGPDAYWQLLSEGRDAVTDVPPDRWNVDEYHDPTPGATGGMIARGGGFLDDIAQFDAAFFGITPREARSLDPRHRILLEVAWEALEHAAQAPDRLAESRTGVFVGACGSDYYQRLLDDRDTSADPYLVSGVASSMAAGRIAYLLGLHGPAIAIDTACSSSLVATHLACQSLRLGESDLALAAGTTLILSPEISIGLSSAGMLSPDSRCRTFDAGANGIVRGEGVGVVVLKRLSDATADSDNILAVIRGTAVNQDGRSSGITAPNGPSQVSVIREALRQAGVDPVDVDYVEAHGTGTSLGDPIEVRAIGAALCEGRPANLPLRIGSVKTNFGHLEASAGIAGLIKAVLSLGHEQLPPHLHFEQPSPHIDWETLPIEVPTTLSDWPRRTGPRTAGVSSFGFSGTNAHVVLQEAPVVPPPPEVVERPAHLLTLSARNASSLSRIAASYQEILATGDVDPADFCHTANTGRAHFHHRVAVVGRDSRELAEGLSATRGDHVSRDASIGIAESTEPSVAFLFTGQGSQYPGMGEELYHTSPRFRSTLETCDEILRAHTDEPLLSVLFDRSDPATSLIHRTEYTQPALFALEYALADLWLSWGIRPGIVLGHSLGQYTAACVAGVFTLEEGLGLIARRAQLMQALPEAGAMAVVFASEDVVTRAIEPFDGAVSIAAINGPANTVISGTARAVEAVVDELTSSGCEVQPLKVSHGFHSALMEPMLVDLEAAVGEVSLSEPTLPLVSNLSGEVARRGELTSAPYWRDHTRLPVRFADGMTCLRNRGHGVFLEIGPRPVLSGMGRRMFPQQQLAWLPSLRDGHSDWTQLLRSAGRLYTLGRTPGFEALDRGWRRRRLPLPTYPFDRQPYWPATRPRPRAETTATRAWHDWLYTFEWHAPPRSSSGVAPHLRTPESIARTVRARWSTLAEEAGVRVYEDYAPALDHLCARYALDALRSLGSACRAGKLLTPDELFQDLSILPRHRRLVLRLMEILEEDGYAVRESDGWRLLTAPAPSVDTETLAAHLGDRFPECAAETTVVRACGSALADVLTGKIDPMELLFPGGSVARTEALYQEAPGLRLFNSLLSESVADAIRDTPPAEKIRILEVGAGTGAASAFVLPHLPPDRVDYTYTDVSHAFLKSAREKFADVPFLTYRLLDIGADPFQQGYEARSFDLILAANVLHATPNLDETLSHIRSLLAPGGVLVLLEGTAPQRLGDLTVGLTPGWWSFTDTDLRSYALLPGKAWKKLLGSHGFTDVTTVPEAPADHAAVASRQAVLIARAPATEAPSAGAGGSWLVLGDAADANRLISGSLRERGCTVVNVERGPSFEQISPEHYRLDPSDFLQVERLLGAVKNAGDDAIAGIVHLWSGPCDPTTTSNLIDAVRPGCESALKVVQALATIPTGCKKLVLATFGTHALGTAVTEAGVAQGALWGLGRVVRLEHPDLGCTNVDFGAAITQGDAETFVREVLLADAREYQIAIRSGQVSVLRLAQTEPEPDPAPGPAVDAEGAYLITGGLGGLGLLTASWLVDRGARHLLLVGRSGPSEPALSAIQAFEARGATVQVIQADVGDPAGIDTIRATLGQGSVGLRGVVHAAGALDDGSLLQLDWDRFASVMRAKVEGTWNLHELTRDEDVDFFVLYSSGASFLGSPGQGNHAAANACMDQVAYFRRSLGLPAQTINWGPWSELGAAVRTGVVARAQTEGGQTIHPHEGLEALEYLIARAPEQAAILPMSPEELVRTASELTYDPLYDLLSTPTQTGPAAAAPIGGRGAELRASLQGASRERARGLLLDAIHEEAARVMGLDPGAPLNPGRPLTDLGLDSLMAVELRDAISHMVDRDLPATLLFLHPTLDELCAHLVDDVLGLGRDPGPGTPQRNPTSETSLDGLSEDELADLLAKELER